MNILKRIEETYLSTEKDMSIEDFLTLCKENSSVYENSAERMLRSIGDPELIDTKEDPKLRKIFSNRVIKRYPAFSEFYGMEEVIEQIVSYFKQSAQGLEAGKQILYLMGPVGGGKSSLAERIKSLMEKNPVYVLKAGNQLSPVFESPLGLFSDYAEDMEKEYSIPKRYFPACMSPWALKRLKEFNGDITKFSVVKVYPSIQSQQCISKTEPGDENNQDISTLVGSVNISRLGEFQQNDPDAYSYNGGLCLGNQGLLEFVEMFKAPIKVLHPLLTATQEKNYKGTEPIGAIPFNGIILAHSNESEWEKFVSDKKNEAFLDRVYKISVPYCLRVDEEIKIYEKLIDNSDLKNCVCAPKTMEMLSQFSVMSRLKFPENSTLWSKMMVYNGEDVKNTDPNAKSLAEYKDDAGIREGMTGISTRFAFKVLSKVYNYDSHETAANPIHLLYVLEQEIIKQEFPNDQEEYLLNIIKSDLSSKYADFIGKEIQRAYVQSYSTYGQNIFDKYITFADYWLENNDYRDPNSGEVFDLSALDEELKKIETPSGIFSNKDFRSEVVKFSLRYKAKNKGENPKWDSYEKIKNVIEKKIFANTEELLPVISFDVKSNKENEKKHKDFIGRMKEMGYTDRQIKLVCDWFIRHSKNK